MMEIWENGYMHNRVRMIVASFLIKDLLIDWRWGEQYFWDTLVDADYAINPFSWQWVFGSGLDAAPYFRIFNPDLQAEKFDPNLEYRKKWLDKKGVMLRCIDHNVQKDVAMKLYKMCF
jgi:deoxyribodipyrimidine photo-lyase